MDVGSMYQSHPPVVFLKQDFRHLFADGSISVEVVFQ